MAMGDRTILADTQLDFPGASDGGWSYQRLGEKGEDVSLNLWTSPDSPTSQSRLLLPDTYSDSRFFYIARDTCHPGKGTAGACTFAWRPDSPRWIRIKGEVALLQAEVEGGAKISVAAAKLGGEREFDFPELITVDCRVFAAPADVVRIQLIGPDRVWNTDMLYYFSIEAAPEDGDEYLRIEASVTESWSRLALELGVPGWLSPQSQDPRAPVRNPFRRIDPVAEGLPDRLTRSLADRSEPDSRRFGDPGFYNAKRATD